MKKNFVSVAFLLLLLSSSLAFSGVCDYPDERAKDGSMCGDRAASVKPGGRNPDTDWIVWAIIIGGGVFFLIKITNKRPHNSSDKYRTQQQTKRTSYEPASHQEDASHIKKSIYTSDQANSSEKISKEDIERNKVLGILRVTFDQAVEPEFMVMLDKMILQTIELGGNNYDAASRYVMAYMGSMDGIPGDNITQYYDIQTRNLYRNRHKATLFQELLLDGLNEIRASRGLSGLGEV